MANTSTPDGSTFKHDTHQLGQSVQALKADIGSVAQSAYNTARSGASELAGSASHAVDAAKEKIADAKDATLEAAESLKGVITRNPMTSIGIAAGLGLIVGLIVFRPRN